MDLSPGVLPQTRQTWREKPSRELFAELVSRYPRASETTLRKHFHEEALSDNRYLEAIIDYAFDAAWRAYERHVDRPHPSATERASIAVQRAAEMQAHAERVEAIKEKIILLNQEMPNGKRARYCTLDYMFRLGGAYRRVGKKGSQSFVGAIYDEEKYRAKLQGVL